MNARQLMVVVWPAFLAACALELLVFAWVDPSELPGGIGARGWSRQSIYSAAFFLFWFIAAGTSALTLVLYDSVRPPPR